VNTNFAPGGKLNHQTVIYKEKPNKLSSVDRERLVEWCLKNPRYGRSMEWYAMDASWELDIKKVTRGNIRHAYDKACEQTATMSNEVLKGLGVQMTKTQRTYAGKSPNVQDMPPIIKSKANTSIPETEVGHLTSEEHTIKNIPKPKEECCEICRFARTPEPTIGYFVCCKTHPSSSCEFPTVLGNQWCGEYEPIYHLKKG